MKTNKNPKIIVSYCSEFGIQHTTKTLKELESFIKNYKSLKIVKLDWEK